MSTITPCITCEKKFKQADLELVKLELENAAGNVRSKKVPVFTASIGVEGLFHANSKFDKAAERLNFQVADKWNYYEDALDATAADKWENLIAPIANNQRTGPRFNQTVAAFLHECTEDPEPRDTLIKHLKNDVWKPRNVSRGECPMHFVLPVLEQVKDEQL